MEREWRRDAEAARPRRIATFPTGADALAAAIEMQRRIRGLDTGGEVDPARLLKIGIHEGPCIAVTANGRLDYFGTTINTASRVEHECRGVHRMRVEPSRILHSADL